MEAIERKYNSSIQKIETILDTKLEIEDIKQKLMAIGINIEKLDIFRPLTPIVKPASSKTDKKAPKKQKFLKPENPQKIKIKPKKTNLAIEDPEAGFIA